MYHCEMCESAQQKKGDGYCDECGGNLCNCENLFCFAGAENEEILFTIARTLRRIEKSLKGR